MIGNDDLARIKGKKKHYKKNVKHEKDKRKAKKKNIYTIKNSQSTPIYKNLTKHCVFLIFLFFGWKGFSHFENEITEKEIAEVEQKK